MARFYDYCMQRLVDVTPTHITETTEDGVATYPIPPDGYDRNIRMYSHILRDKRKAGRRPAWLVQLEGAINGY